MWCQGSFALSRCFFVAFLINICKCALELLCDADKLWNVWAASYPPLSLAPFSTRNPAMCQLWRKAFGDYYYVCFVDCNENHLTVMTQSYISKWDYLICFDCICRVNIKSIARVIQKQKGMGQGYGHERFCQQSLQSDDIHSFPLLQTKILSAAVRRCPYFASDKRTSTGSNVKGWHEPFLVGKRRRKCIEVLRKRRRRA